jgi:hypothetical protein
MPDPDSDLTASGWRPEYTGDDRLGNVGHGEDFGADLYDLYRAGRNELPATARTYSDLTTQVHRRAGYMEASFDAPGRGPTAAHRALLELRDELHDVLRLTCIRLQEIGEALVTTADSYAATDEEAAEEFTRKLDVSYHDPASDDYRDFYGQAPIVPEPPAVGAPQPPGQHDDGQPPGGSYYTGPASGAR